MVMMLSIMELWVGPTLAPDHCLALLHISPPNHCSILIFKATAIHLSLLIATPSPVLGSFYLHTSHLCPSVFCLRRQGVKLDCTVEDNKWGSWKTKNISNPIQWKEQSPHQRPNPPNFSSEILSKI